MALSLTHAIGIPIRRARFSFPLEWRDSAGALTNPTSPDTELSSDGGASFTDCTEEVSPTSGFGYMTLTGDEMDSAADLIVQSKGTGVLTATVVVSLRDFPVFAAGTAQAGAASSITLPATFSDDTDFYVGMWVRTTGGTGGGGGSGDSNNQARVIIAYNGTTKVATVNGTWETNPSSDTTFDLLLPDLAMVAHSDLSKYQVQVTPFIDTSTDIYGVVFHKDAQPITSGITSPTIQVIKVSDGTDLVGATSLTEIASLGLYKHTESSNRMTGGLAYMAKIQATIDGATRTWYRPIGRDA